MPSFITPDEMRAGVQKVQDLAATAGRQVPEDHFGTLINFALADTGPPASRWRSRYIPRGRVDETTIRQCTAFGPAGRPSSRIEEYVKAGGLEVHPAPPGPSERMLDQLAGWPTRSARSSTAADS